MAIAPGGEVRVGGIQAAVTRMEVRTAALKNPRKPMLQTVTGLFQAIQRNWQDQGSDDGPWQALKPKTARRKALAGRSPLILIWSGALKRDWDLTVSPDGTQGVVKSRHFYGTFHELGMGHNPTRHILPAESRRREIALRYFKDYVSTVAEGASGT
jgi:phage gpG-like protein